jgi:hypothetical protein
MVIWEIQVDYLNQFRKSYVESKIAEFYPRPNLMNFPVEISVNQHLFFVAYYLQFIFPINKPKHTGFYF